MAAPWITIYYWNPSAGIFGNLSTGGSGCGSSTARCSHEKLTASVLLILRKRSGCNSLGSQRRAAGIGEAQFLVEVREVAGVVVAARNLFAGLREPVEFPDFIFLRAFEPVRNRALHFFF